MWRIRHTHCIRIKENTCRQDITKKGFSQTTNQNITPSCTSNKRETGFELETGEETWQFLRNVGIQEEHEKSVRELSREIVSNFVKVENRLFVKEDTVEYEVPYSRIEDLPKFVASVLDSYNNKMHLLGGGGGGGGSIPQDEIWVKIGGDHGENSLKFTLQIASLERPNARHSTVVIAIASVRDTHG